MGTTNAILVADEIIQLYKNHGSEEYAGEKVTQLEHMVQAASLAAQEGYDEEVILAAFLHDIGHICVEAMGENEMDGFGIKEHEMVGANFLREKGFSEKLIRLVISHVEAKRYLTSKNPAYYAQLSEASKQTLSFQGGPMNETECIAFENDPYFELMIKMRQWDDAAKVVGAPAVPLDTYRNMLIRHLYVYNEI
jgi:phosphonate degradation associated HDIG domain protein